MDAKQTALVDIAFQNVQRYHDDPVNRPFFNGVYQNTDGEQTLTVCYFPTVCPDLPECPTLNKKYAPPPNLDSWVCYLSIYPEIAESLSIYLSSRAKFAYLSLEMLRN